MAAATVWPVLSKMISNGYAWFDLVSPWLHLKPLHLAEDDYLNNHNNAEDRADFPKGQMDPDNIAVRRPAAHVIPSTESASALSIQDYRGYQSSAFHMQPQFLVAWNFSYSSTLARRQWPTLL
jgi:hypothetical protein